MHRIFIDFEYLERCCIRIMQYYHHRAQWLVTWCFRKHSPSAFGAVVHKGKYCKCGRNAEIRFYFIVFRAASKINRHLFIFFTVTGPLSQVLFLSKKLLYCAQPAFLKLLRRTSTSTDQTLTF